MSTKSQALWVVLLAAALAVLAGLLWFLPRYLYEALSRGTPLWHFSEGNRHFWRHEYNAATEQYDKVIQLMPDWAGPYYMLGEVHMCRGEYDAAVADYTKAIELSERPYKDYNARAIAHFRRLDYDKAWADVKECQRLGGTVDPGFLAELRKASGRPE